MKLEAITRSYEKAMLIGAALTPAVVIWYLSVFSATPPLRFEHHGFHEGAIAVATLVGGFISYVSWRSYRDSGEVFLRWLTVGFLAFTLIYAPHGLLTRTAHHNIWLFLLYGPASRLAMIGCLIVGLAQYGKPRENPIEVSQSGFWRHVFLACGAVIVAVAALANSPVASSPWVRMSMEISAVILCVVALGLMALRQIKSPLMRFYAGALAIFAQAAIAFLLAKPWNHMWWLAHAIFAGGFFVLSWGVARALLTTRSFSLAYSQEQLMRSLEHEKALLQESEGRLSSIVETSMDAVVQMNTEGVITGWNRQTEDVFGWAEAEVIGRMAHEMIIPSEHREAHVQGLKHFLLTGEGPILSKRIEITGLHRDGRVFPVELAITPIRKGGQTEFNAFIRDITERKEFELKILSSNIELEKLNSAITGDLLVAKDIMSHIMRSEGLRDPQIRHFLRPTEQFSGDIISASRDDKGGLRIMLADATGHGLQAALFLLPIFRVFRAMVKKGLPTCDIVTEMNQTMRGIAETGHFIAAAVAHITYDGYSIEIWNGGIPTAFYAAKNGELHKFHSRHPPLGLLGADAFEATTEIFHAQTGALVLCSDGLIEAEDASGKPFGEDRFENILRTSQPDDIFDNVLSALETHLGGGIAHDDLSMILARCGD